MNEIKSKILESLFFAFKKAPKGFCNSDNSEILTMEDIELRQFFQTGGLPSISDKEMVFRKLVSEINDYNRFPGRTVFNPFS